MQNYSWTVGDKLTHKGFGEGEVTHVFGSSGRFSIAVQFEGVGPKILDPSHAPITISGADAGNAGNDAGNADNDIDLDLPVRVPVAGRSQWRWKGAEFATREEMLLGKALLEQGAMVASNAHLLLRESSKLHRKPDLIVFLQHDNRLLSGIAEIDGSAHDGRWVEDQTRSHELQRNGFMAVRHYTAEQVFQDPNGVAVDFLGFLKQFTPFGQRDSLLVIDRPVHHDLRAH